MDAVQTSDLPHTTAAMLPKPASEASEATMKAQEPDTNGTRLLLVKEVAEELRLTEKAVRHLVYAGQLKAYYMAGRRLCVKRADLDQFLATQLLPT
jgi:excisionase family DNA binding protein